MSQNVTVHVSKQCNNMCAFRKSTFFNVLTKSAASAENFPFCTIDPNESKLNQDRLLDDFSRMFFSYLSFLSERPPFALNREGACFYCHIS